MSTDTSVIMHLDFEVVIPCDHPEHPAFHDRSENALYYTQSHCSACEGDNKFFMCESGFLLYKVFKDDLICNVCNVPGTVSFVILYTLRSK